MTDEEAARREAVRLYPTEHVGYDRPVPSNCRCDECYQREAQRDAYVAGRLAVVREHPPVKPSREQAVRAFWNGYEHSETEREGFDAGIAAVWSLFPGRSEAEVKAEALQEASNTARRYWTGSTNLPDPADPSESFSFDAWLGVLADRLAFEGGAGRG